MYRNELVSNPDVVLAVQPPALEVIRAIKEGASLSSFIGATIAALVVATMTVLPAAFAQPMPPDLPGFPGASAIYHVGATGFFLDYTAGIKLTADQQAALNGIKEKSIGDLGAAQRKIDQAEQELWMLTGSDRPDAMTLEMKVREIERLKGDQRLAFIRSVGDAARVLTDEQRTALLGTGAPGAAQMTVPQGSGSVNPQGGMGSTDPKAGMAGMGDDSMGNMGGNTPDPNSNPGAMGDM